MKEKTRQDKNKDRYSMNAPPQPLLPWAEAVDDRLTYTIVLIIVLAVAVRLGE